MGEPKYRAYKPVNMTDGILTWVQHTFDNSIEMTPDDEEMFVAMLEGLSPEERIRTMQANLDGLQNFTPAIKLHADAIRAVHAGLDNHFSVNREGLASLQRADDLWAKIIVLRDVVPKAVMGAKSSKNQSDRAKLPRKLSESQSQRIATIYEQHLSEGSVYGVVKALSNEYGVTTKTINHAVKKSRKNMN